MNNLEFKTALRSLRKKRLFALVNMGGLTFGLLCALFIGTYVLHQFSFDKHHPDAESIYRVLLNRDSNGLKEKSVLGPTGMKPLLDENLAQVKLAARIQRAGQMVFGAGEEFLKENGGFYADKSYLELFGTSLVEGNESNALDEPYGLVISQSLKEKYFGDEPAVGKTLELSSAYRTEFNEYVVRGVFADVPKNAHFRPDYLLSMERLRLRQNRPIDAEWSNFNAFTYVKLAEGVDKVELEGLIDKAIETTSANFDERGHSVFLQPIADIHMQDFVAFGEIPGQVSRSTMFILMGIGGLILILVCINFFNLSMARSLERAKEVGVRKSVGASRFQLIRLYLIEGGIQVAVSLLLAVILFEMSGNVISSYLGIPVSMAQMTTGLGIGTFIAFAILLCSVLIIGAGMYPALVLSGFQPVEALKGKVKLKSNRFSLRQSLLVIQFMITLVIGIVASIIYSQVNFMETADPGYARESTVSFQVFDDDKMSRFAQELRTNPLVGSVTFGDGNIWELFNSSSDYNWEGRPEDQQYRVYRLSIDNNFIDAMDITLLEGRSFDEKLASDSSSVILNESAATLMGISSLADFPTIRKGETVLNVVGIVKDFQVGSFRQANRPVVLWHNPGRLFNAYVRLNSTNKAAALKSIETTWKEVMPKKPFEYRFLDEAYEAILEKDRVTSQVLLFFTGLSILISFIGLFGMIRLRVQYRQKEMGIRKILGATFVQILNVVSKEFAIYLFLAVLAGIPIAVILGRSWLDKFADRISIGISQPVLVVLGMGLIALCTLLLSAFPLNRLNLVETLKDE